MPYSAIVFAGSDGLPVFANDSDHDVDVSGGATTLVAGGKLTFNFTSDCGAPINETVDFDATFTRCTTDNCEVITIILHQPGTNYYISTSF